MSEYPETVSVTETSGLKPLDPSIRKVWSITLGAWSSLLVIIVFTYEIVQFFSEETRFLPFGTASLMALFLGLVFSLVLPRLRYRYWRYELRTEELLLVRGILNRVHTIIPLRRIQHLDVSQNIVEREFDLAKLIVHTAGTRSNEVVLPGLKISVAEQLRDDVKHYILEDTL